MITDQEGRRTFETDALTAYRCLPLAVVLRRPPRRSVRSCAICHENKIKVVPRGAGTSLSGGALPLEDAIVLGIIAHEQGAVESTDESRGPSRGRHHQYRHHPGRRRRTASSMRRTRRARSPARSAAMSPPIRAARIA